VHAKIAKRVSHVPVDAIVSVVRRRAAVLNSYNAIFKVLYFFTFITNIRHSLNTHINM
jgi:hypothetical protein